jgi:hypothetical protein
VTAEANGIELVDVIALGDPEPSECLGDRAAAGRELFLLALVQGPRATFPTSHTCADCVPVPPK